MSGCLAAKFTQIFYICFSFEKQNRTPVINTKNDTTRNLIKDKNAV